MMMLLDDQAIGGLQPFARDTNDKDLCGHVG